MTSSTYLNPNFEISLGLPIKYIHTNKGTRNEKEASEASSNRSRDKASH
jgi:hypothetical protein